MDVTTWEAMVLAEPGLRRLEEDIAAFVGTTHQTDEGEIELVWYRGFKPRLVALVGWHGRHACLQSPTAYDVAYTRLYDRLMAACDRVEASR